MLYHLFYPLHEAYSAFNVFRYITFRAVYAIVTAFLISLIFGPLLIRKLKEYHIGQEIREEGPKTHFSKAGTPTMGGLLILIALVLPSLLWADLTNRYVWLILFSTLGFGSIGFWDDYLKVIKKRNLGLQGRYKLVGQTIVGLGVALFLYYYPSNPEYATRLGVPFFKTVLPDLDGLYIPFAILLVVGASNAVNLTDGLDGLAIVPVIVSMIAYMV
ncbi:MAG: phospho-N-acetylmuramoyl-pentapeptide-transferase, partial [Candidatus Tectomicrobia bacterium]|nr:phospho-N-acetylmuramoyl-pentapeptide-transferase [Candidatus Tectomicrobia bacterium]